mgnify:CR=1 FL=1
MAGITTYESDSRNRIAPESIMENQMLGLEIVDGHAVKAPADYQDPDELYRMLIGRIRKYHPSTDVSMVEKAYRIAKNAHEGQCRKSGEPYIILLCGLRSSLQTGDGQGDDCGRDAP